MLGYYIEVRPNHADKLTARRPGRPGAFFIHRQTIAGAVRFTTVELAELETKISRAADRALALELQLFEELSAAVHGARRRDRRRGAGAAAAIDVAAALAELAEEQQLDAAAGRRQPRLPHRGRAPSGGRGGAQRAGGRLHRQRLRSHAGGSCGAKGSRLWLVTGPNMAGKSTFLRQNALIAILAQTGSFVPADSAHIGVVDRLFSRVGAADDLARGRSTFMVEMVETAAILNQAGQRALVILDEIGRGTATFDGLSIAWATIEHLHEANRCRALFATHYHELTALAARLPQPRQPPCASRNGRATSCSCTRWRRAPPTAPTASMSRSSPACRRRGDRAPRKCCAALEARRQGQGGRQARRRPAAVLRHRSRAAAPARASPPPSSASSPRSTPTS